MKAILLLLYTRKIHDRQETFTYARKNHDSTGNI